MGGTLIAPQIYTGGKEGLWEKRGCDESWGYQVNTLKIIVSEGVDHCIVRVFIVFAIELNDGLD